MHIESTSLKLLKGYIINLVNIKTNEINKTPCKTISVDLTSLDCFKFRLVKMTMTRSESSTKEFKDEVQRLSIFCWSHFFNRQIMTRQKFLTRNLFNANSRDLNLKLAGIGISPHPNQTKCASFEDIFGIYALIGPIFSKDWLNRPLVEIHKY